MGVGEKGENTLFERKGKKDPPSIRSKTETHFGPMRNLQTLSQNLFNHCMGDATASLRANDRGFCTSQLRAKVGKEEGRYHVSIKLGIQRASEWGCCLLQALGVSLLGLEPFLSGNYLTGKSETTTFVVRLAPPVIPATGTQPVDQG